eukprot:365987-Chlamydomonas_euryale.AAC.2
MWHAVGMSQHLPTPDHTCTNAATSGLPRSSGTWPCVGTYFGPVCPPGAGADLEGSAATAVAAGTATAGAAAAACDAAAGAFFAPFRKPFPPLSRRCSAATLTDRSLLSGHMLSAC